MSCWQNSRQKSIAFRGSRAGDTVRKKNNNKQTTKTKQETKAELSKVFLFWVRKAVRLLPKHPPNSHSQEQWQKKQ